MDIIRVMIPMKQVEEDKFRGRKEFRNKKARTSWNDSEKQKHNMYLYSI